MVDIEKAKKEFNNYVSKYDIKKGKIKNKVLHSYRVMDISKKIAQSLNLLQEEIEIATLIGLLHDIARFEQFSRYKTFRDIDSIDHGNLGVEILKKNNFIRKFIDVDRYDNIIIKAIKNHNKFEIEQNLTKEEELYAKIIRDADKLDIFYESAYIFWKDSKYEVENSIITPYTEDEFHKQKLISRNKVIGTNELDKIIITIAFIFDIYFPETFRILKEKDYINTIINQFSFKDDEVKEKIEKIRETANHFIEINQ